MGNFSDRQNFSQTSRNIDYEQLKLGFLVCECRKEDNVTWVQNRVWVGTGHSVAELDKHWGNINGDLKTETWRIG